MNWRPDNYKESRDKRIDAVLKHHNLSATGSIILAEASADAMLESLRQKGLHGEFTSVEWTGYVDGPSGESFHLPTHRNPKKGTLIIIPDDDNET